MSWSKGAAAPVEDGPPPSPPPPYEPWPAPPEEGRATLDAQDAWKSIDPRSSSTQSLLPSLNEGQDRRTLLIVYIHGFMGDNTSFQSFPAHVHCYLREELSDSHVIHSKIYPRYKTYKAIEVARDNFSKWLEPHEDDNTDVILIGHSMGGLLAADVALMPSPNPVYGGPFKHRILGTISLDAPLLGLHPGIIKSGIASLFRKAPDPPGREQELAGSMASPNASGSLSLDGTPSFSDLGSSSSMTSTTAPLSTMSSNASTAPPLDPNFNPAFFNDVPFVDRGWWKNVTHFAKKHYSEGLFSSTYQHLVSHLEFGSCLADYSSLNNRYNKIRRLEDVDELNQVDQGSGRDVRVRFVNYYTVSTGIPKAPPQPSPQPPPLPKRSDTHLRPESSSPQPQVTSSSQASTPRISIEDYSDNEMSQTLQLLEPEPMPEPDNEVEEEQAPRHDSDSTSNAAGPLDGVTVDGESQRKENESNGPGIVREGASVADSSQHNPLEDEANDPNIGLPAIPPPPEAPQAPDLERFTDKEARKQAEKEFKRVQKTYNQAVKNHDKAVKERQKLVEKRQKKAQKDAEKRQKEEAKRLAKEQQERGKQEKIDAAQDDLDSAVAATPSRAQAATPAQAAMLERQLTNLAFHDQNSPSPSSPPPPHMAGDKGKENAVAASKEKLHKFCMLPQKVNGRRDPAWVQVYMKGVDEVGAHCGLFFPGPHYEPLIGDVGGRIVSWVQNDATKRAILSLD